MQSGPLLSRTREDLLKVIQKGHPIETSTPAGCKFVAGMTFHLPPQFPNTIPGLPDTGTLWCMLQHQANTVLGPNNPLNNFTNLANGLSSLPSLPDLSINSALTAVQGKFQGFNTEGYLDISKDLGLDYSLHAAADGTLSAEVEAEATLPLFPSNNSTTAIPRLAVGHQVRMCHRHPDFTALHSLKMSMPVAKGNGTAKLRVKQSPVGGNPGLSLELGGGRKHLAKLGIVNSRKDSTNNTSDDEEDTIHDGTNNNADNKKTETNSILQQKNNNTQRPVLCRIPQLKLDIDPLIPIPSHVSVLSSTVPRHIGFHWHQTWSSTVRTAAVYRSRSRKLQVDARAKIIPTMLVSAGAVVDSTHRTVHKAVAKLLWKPGRSIGSGAGGARHAVQLESKYSKEGGVHHVVKVRRRPKASVGLEASVSVNFTQENITRPVFQFDFYSPI